MVGRLDTATAHRDYKTICDQLFAAATRAQAGGTDCPAMLATRARGVRRPRIVVRSIVVQGSQARARVMTTAGGQAPTAVVIRLVREHGQFRVSSLGP